MRRKSFLIVALAVTPLATLAAQDPLPVKSGDRVRLSALEATSGQSRQFVGRIMRFVSDSVVFRTEDGKLMSTPLTSITQLEWSSGRKPFGAIRGAIAGAAVAAPVAALIGFALYEECVVEEFDFLFSNCTFALDRKETVAAAALLGGVGGAVLGAILGATIKGERWHEVDLDRYRPGIALQRDGAVALRLTVVF